MQPLTGLPQSDNFKNIKSFYIAQPPHKEFKDLKVDDRYFLKDDINFKDIVKDYPYCCIIPVVFDKYAIWVDEFELYKDEGYFRFNEDDFMDVDGKEYIASKRFDEIQNLLTEFYFFKLVLRTPEEGKVEKLYIEEIYNSQQIIEYWIKQNCFTDFTKTKNIGIGKKIFDLIPANHNYFDRFLICNCGSSCCDHIDGWYIKFNNSYSIPFMIHKYHTLIFDTSYVNEEGCFTYNEKAKDKKEKPYNSFPFSMEEDQFKISEPSLFANNKFLELLK